MARPSRSTRSGDRQVLALEHGGRHRAQGRPPRRTGWRAACRSTDSCSRLTLDARPCAAGRRYRTGGSRGRASCQSTEIESRVMPGSGPVSSRSSPIMRLISVDLPAFGPADDGETQRPTRAVLLRLRPRPVVGPAAAGRRTALPGPDMGGHRVVEAAEAFAVLGGDRHRIAEAKRVGLHGARRRRPRASHLLATRITALPVARSHWPKWESSGVTPSRASNSSSATSACARARSVCARIAASTVTGRGILEAGRVEQPEAHAGEAGLAFAPVAGDAGLRLDDGEPLADQAVEQGGLADVRAADDGDGGDHMGPSGRRSDRRRR